MINIDDKTRRLSQATIVVGYKQENKAESIEFKIPDYLKEYGKKICFKTKDGKVFSKLFDNTTSNIFTFTRTETQYGELNATIEFFKTENEDMIVYKTSMLHIIFNETINCEDEVQPDEPKIPILESLIEKVTDLNNTITENEETRNNNEDTRISNENSRIANETQRDIYYTGMQNKVNNGEFNGATFTPSVDKDGNISWTNNKGLENPTSQNIRGPQGIQGPQGEAFKIKKTYPSIEAMQNDFDNMEVGDYAMIVTSIELEDNAKLYSRTETEWVFITDFSGATGIQGPQGIQGIQGIQGERGIGISKLEVIDGSLWVTLTDSTTQNAGLIITDEVKQWLVTEITNNAESTFNQYYDTKVSEFNENVQAKLDEYNANAEALANKVVELETENTSLKNQIPSGEEVGNPIHLTDSSDLECEIAVVGNSEQETREGYNLWNLGNKDNTSGDINFELGSGNYTISFIKKRIANSTISNTWIYRYGYIKFYDTNNTLLSTISDKTAIELTANQTSERQNISFNAPENTAKMVINFSNNNGDNNKNTEVIDIQLIKGTEEKPYEPYGAMPSPDYPSEIVTVGQNGSVEIEVCNKNFLGLKDIEENTLNGITYSCKNGVIKLNGTATRSFGIILKHNKFTLFKGIKYVGKMIVTNKPGVNTSVISIRDMNNNSRFYMECWVSPKIIEITPEDNIYFKDDEKTNLWINSGTIFSNTEFIIQIEEGSNATDYIPHESYTKVLPIQKEFVKINDVEDTFVKVDGKWYEKHNIKKLILDGTEGYTQSSAKTSVFILNLKELKKIAYNSYVSYDLTSNMFRIGISHDKLTQNDNYNNYIAINKNPGLSFRNDNFVTIDTFKSWVAEQYANGTPVIVYYVLQEPELIPCTEDQKSVLNSFYTYKNVTNVSMSGIGTLKVNYKKDLETMFNNIIKQIPSSTSDTTET